MRRNPFEKYLTKEDILQNQVMAYLRIKHPKVLAIHVPNEGRRSPFERYKFKYLGGKAGIPDILVFYQNDSKAGLAIELKVGYNKPTDNQKQCLELLKMSNWDAQWVNTYENAVTLIDNYFNNYELQI